MENVAKNKKVEFIEKAFGIELPEFTLHTTCRKPGNEYNGSTPIPDSARWEHVKGSHRLPPELEIHLPSEGMTPSQAIIQLKICSALSCGWGNDAYQIYSQEVMMRFLFVAITNCIYLASRDYGSWSERIISDEEDTHLKSIRKEMSIFREAFGKLAPSRYTYQRKIGHLFLRLLLEKNAPLNKGTEMSGAKGFMYINGNTIKDLLMAGSGEAYSYAIPNDDWLWESISRLIGQKCYELTEQLLELDK